MKKILVFLFAFFTFNFSLFLTLSLSMCTFHSFSQGIGINTTGNEANNSAMLDVSSTTQGVRIPRVALTSTTSPNPINNPVNSLLIYDTVTINDVTPGFYYWDNTSTPHQWVRLATGAGNDWKTTGNTGINSGTNFLGSTDNFSLGFRTNNIKRMIIDSTGNVGIGTILPNDALEVNGSITATGLQDTGKTTNIWLSGATVLANNLDYMEYSTDSLTQTVYVSNDPFDDLCTGGTPSASTEYDGCRNAAKAFDDTFSTCWLTTSGNTTGWIKYDFGAGNSKIINTVGVRQNVVVTGGCNSADAVRMPKNFTVEGSDNDISWTTLKTVSNETNWNNNEIRYYDFTNSTAYRYYRINITANNGDATFLTTTEIEMKSGGYLLSHSESTIKTQGSYSLKGIAVITNSLNKTLTRTVSPAIDLTGQTQIKIDIRASRTGSNIKIGIHDAGGVTTEITPNIISTNTWQTVIWDISAVINANKDAINQIIITIVNADQANTFYVDNMFTPVSDISHDIVFTTAGSERMRINTSGNVGIGTVSPSAKLQIGGTAGVDGIKFPDGTLQTTAGGAAITFGTGNPPTSNSTQTITHGLGKTPTYIKIKGLSSGTSDVGVTISEGVYNGSNFCIYSKAASSIGISSISTSYSIYMETYQSGVKVATGVIGNVGATTFDIVWSSALTNGNGGVYLWEAQ